MLTETVHRQHQIPDAKDHKTLVFSPHSESPRTVPYRDPVLSKTPVHLLLGFFYLSQNQSFTISKSRCQYGPMESHRSWKTAQKAVKVRWLSSGAQHTCKKSGMSMHACNPSRGKQVPGTHWPASLNS